MRRKQVICRLSVSRWAPLIVYRNDNGVRVITLHGPRLDAVGAPALRASLTEHVNDRPSRVIVDASALEYSDSSGLGVIVSLLKMMDRSGRLAIAGPAGAVRRAFEKTRLDQLVVLTNTLDEAYAAMAR